MGASDKSCRCFWKCCGICSCVVVVVLAVMIPVGILVIAPKMAQQTLNDAELIISNATMYQLPAGPALKDGVVGKLANTGTMSSSFPLGATVEPFEVHLIANGGFAKADPTVSIASFKFPQLDVKKGINKAVFTTDLLVLNSTVLADFGLTTQFCKFWDDCIPSMGVPSLNLTMKGTVTLKTMGSIKIGNLNVEKHLNCIGLTPPTTTAAMTTTIANGTTTAAMTTTTANATNGLTENVEVVESRRLGGDLTIMMQCRMQGSDALNGFTTPPPMPTTPTTQAVAV